MAERRSVPIVGAFTVPWDYPEGRIPFDHYIRSFIERQLAKKEGWTFERILSVRRDVALFFDEGKGRRHYVINALFSRVPVLHRLDIPDHLLVKLMQRYPERYNKYTIH